MIRILFVIIFLFAGSFGLYWSGDPTLKWLLVSVGVGGIGCDIFVLLGPKLMGVGGLGSEPSSLPTWRSGYIVGIVERIFFTLIVGSVGVESCMAAGFIWLGLKAQTQYNVFSADVESVPRGVALIAILAGMISLGVAYWAGMQIYGS